MAHVYAADQGLQLQNETVDSIMFDDAALLLLVIKGGVVFAYDVALDIPTQHEQLVWTYPLQEGPPVICARCSLDRQLLALQRSKLLVELVDLVSGNISVMQSDKGRSELLGLFFSEWSEAQVVLLSRTGLEMCTLAARRQGLHSRERLRLPVHWYQYSHETRCCLVATGPPLGPPYYQAWQFVSTGLVTLPPFALASSALGTALSIAPSAGAPANVSASLSSGGNGNGNGNGSVTSSRGGTPVPVLPISTHASAGDEMAASMLRAAAAAAAAPGANPPSAAGTPAATPTARTAAVSEVNKTPPWNGGLASWMGGGGAAAEVLPGTSITSPTGGPNPVLWPNVTVGTGSEAVVPASSVRLLKIYGRVYCAHVNRSSLQLDLYRLFTDTVVLQHSYAIPSTRVQLSVVDNVLVVHQLATASALLVDVCADASTVVSDLRPLGHLAPLRRPRQLEEEKLQQQLQRQARAAAGAGAMLGSRGPLAPPTAWSVVDEEGQLVPHADWQFCMPNLIVDMRSQVVYRMLLDLTAITRDCMARPATLAAFLQRRRAPRLHVLPLDSLSYPNPPSPQPSDAASTLPNASVFARTSSPPGSASAPPAALSAPTTLSAPAVLSAPTSTSQLDLGLALRSGWSGNNQLGLGLTPSLERISAGGGQVVGSGHSADGTSGTAGRLSPAEMLLGSAHPHPVMLSGVVTPSAITSKLLLLQLTQRLLLEEAALPVLQATFEAIAKAYAEVAVAASAGRASAAAAACVLSPVELVQHVLMPMCSGVLSLARHTYLQGAVCELTFVMVSLGIAPPACLQLLPLQLMASQPLDSASVTDTSISSGGHTTLSVPPGPFSGFPLPAGSGSSSKGRPLLFSLASGPDAAPWQQPWQQRDGMGSSNGEGQLVRALHCCLQLLRGDVQPSAIAALPGAAAAAAAAALRVQRAAGARLGVDSGNFTPSGVPQPPPAAAQQQQRPLPPAAPAEYLPGLNPTGSGWDQAGSGGGGGQEAMELDSGSVLVRSLLQAGRVVKAARVARELRVTGVTTHELLTVAATREDCGVQVALSRCFRNASLVTAG